MVRSVNVELLTQNIKEMCIQANHYLAPDMDKAMKDAHEKETKPLAKQILGQLLENLEIAGEDMIPICQDTGMAVVFLKIGQDVHFEGGSVEDAVNEGVRQGYQEGYPLWVIRCFVSIQKTIHRLLFTMNWYRGIE